MRIEPPATGAMQDYIVAWTQGLWDFIHAHENPDRNQVSMRMPPE